MGTTEHSDTAAEMFKLTHGADRKRRLLVQGAEISESEFETGSASLTGSRIVRQADAIAHDVIVSGSIVGDGKAWLDCLQTAVEATAKARGENDIDAADMGRTARRRYHWVSDLYYRDRRT